MSGELKPRKRCYTRQDFITHATEMWRLCQAKVEEGGDREAMIAWKAKAQTWLLVGGWLKELPDFQGAEREREI